MWATFWHCQKKVGFLPFFNANVALQLIYYLLRLAMDTIMESINNNFLENVLTIIDARKVLNIMK